MKYKFINKMIRIENLFEEFNRFVSDAFLSTPWECGIHVLALVKCAQSVCDKKHIHLLRAHKKSLNLPKSSL